MIPIYLFMVALYVRPQDWVPGMVGLPTAYLIIPLGLLIGFTIRSKEPEKFKVPQAWVLAAYLVVIFVSTFINTDFSRAYDQFDIFAKRFTVFFMLIWILTSSKRIESTLWTCMLLSGFLAYQAMLQAETGTAWGGQVPEPGYAEIRVRWYGDWDGPNVYALLFVIAFGMGMEYMLGKHGMFKKLVATCLCVSYIIAIFHTNSRGAVLAVGVMLLYYFRSRFKSIFSIGAAGLLIAALLAFGPSRMSEVSSKESSAHERTWLWEQGLALLKENPFFGVGRGEFSHRVDLQLIAHNNFVQNFTETGMLGFGCFSLLLWYSFKGNKMVSEPQYHPPPEIAAHARIMTTMLVGYLAVTFFVVMELDLLYFVLGLCAASYLVARRNIPELPQLALTRHDFMVTSIGMVIVLVMIWLAAVKQIV